MTDIDGPYPSSLHPGEEYIFDADGYGDMTLWIQHPNGIAQPVVREGNVHPDVWAMVCAFVTGAVPEPLDPVDEWAVPFGPQQYPDPF